VLSCGKRSLKIDVSASSSSSTPESIYLLPVARPLVKIAVENNCHQLLSRLRSSYHCRFWRVRSLHCVLSR